MTAYFNHQIHFTLTVSLNLSDAMADGPFSKSLILAYYYMENY